VLLASFVLAGAHWEALIGLSETRRALGSLTTVTLVVLGLSVIVALAARRLRDREPVARPGPRAFLVQVLADTGRGLGAAWVLGGSAALGLVQVAALLGSNLLLLRALDLHVSDPSLAAVALMAVGSLVAILLPPTLVAGNAATSVGILGLFGVAQAEGMAFGVLMWAVHCLPTLLLGAWPLWITVAWVGRGVTAAPPDPPVAAR